MLAAEWREGERAAWRWLVRSAAFCTLSPKASPSESSSSRPPWGDRDERRGAAAEAAVWPAPPTTASKKDAAAALAGGKPAMSRGFGSGNTVHSTMAVPGDETRKFADGRSRPLMADSNIQAGDATEGWGLATEEYEQGGRNDVPSQFSHTNCR